jgi:hypothetical protein
MNIGGKSIEKLGMKGILALGEGKSTEGYAGNFQDAKTIMDHPDEFERRKKAALAAAVQQKG